MKEGDEVLVRISPKKTEPGTIETVRDDGKAVVLLDRTKDGVPVRITRSMTLLVRNLFPPNLPSDATYKYERREVPVVVSSPIVAGLLREEHIGERREHIGGCGPHGIPDHARLRLDAKQRLVWVWDEVVP